MLGSLRRRSGQGAESWLGVPSALPLKLGDGDGDVLFDGSGGEAESDAPGDDGDADWGGAGMLTLAEVTLAVFPSRWKVKETVPLPAKTPSNSRLAASGVPSLS